MSSINTTQDLDNDDLDEEVLTGPISPIKSRGWGVGLILVGIIGLFSSMTLIIEKFRIAENPNYVPSCSINPVLSCSPVMSSPEAAVFGFPNPLIGVAAFAVCLFLGVLLVSRVVLPRWIIWGAGIGVTLGTVFVGWLISQALYDIGALCIYCMIVWAAMTPLFWISVLYSLQITKLKDNAVVKTLIDYRVILIILTYILIITLIAVRFWYYWSTLI